MVTIERVAEESLGTFKVIRLQALAESPWAFGSTYAAESQLPEAEWRDRAARCTKEGYVGYFAMEEGEPVGIVRGTPDDEDPGVAWVESMWVAPSHRRCGVGELLIGEVIAWAEGRGLKALLLDVTRGNEPALRLYEKLGFVKTGITKPYPNDPNLIEDEMSLDLA